MSLDYENCPYCKDEIDCETYPSLEDGTTIITCESCGKKFRMSVYTSFLIDTDCTLNNVEHDWDYVKSHDFYRCKNCDELK
jgi:transcription elongation factor Elf1